MARDVEAELRAFEQSAFDALAEGRGEAQTAMLVKTAIRSGAVDNRYENWDARYDGQVTAEYDLAGRKALGLMCRDTVAAVVAVVVMSIEVAPGGEVLERQSCLSAGSGSEAMSECLLENPCAARCGAGFNLRPMPPNGRREPSPTGLLPSKSRVF